MKRLYLVIICLLLVNIKPLPGYSLDRFTMKVGDIFLGSIVDKRMSRFHIERYGNITVIPEWEIKKIEKNQDTLPMSAAGTPIKIATDTRVYMIPSVIISGQQTAPVAVQPTPVITRFNQDDPRNKNMRVFDLMGRQIPVISAPPAEPSHLEMYSRRDHFFVARNRYMRGYLVNQTKRNYKSLQVEITYYTALPGSIDSASKSHTDFRQNKEIFDVYAMTMKPFIVDTHHVEWEKVKRIGIQIIGRSPRGLK